MKLSKKLSLAGLGVVALFSAMASMQSAVARPPTAGMWMEELFYYNGTFVWSRLDDTQCKNGGTIVYAYGVDPNGVPYTRSSTWNQREVKTGPC
ncbi:MAG: hypothetical protein RL748_1035 [Pseudomonadota bacterium]